VLFVLLVLALFVSCAADEWTETNCEAMGHTGGYVPGMLGKGVCFDQPPEDLTLYEHAVATYEAELEEE